jgi:hypothetical protein
MFRSRNVTANLWVQVACVAVLAVAAGVIATSFTPLGGIVKALGDSEPRQIPVPQITIDPSQADILADGVVTRAEYDAAVDRTLACVSAAGGTVNGLRYEDFRDRPIWNFSVAYDRPLSRGELTPYDECWIQYSRDVQAKWVGQNQPSASKAADNEARALECATQESLGVDSLDALNRLDGASLGDKQVGWIRCMTIAHNGYDPHEHPPILVE